ncbi:hypothetical protein N7519_006702 [Penicillium mononematosum]|uniref:uncharacterized protein n=1 Tax=Penicillium mononematosum TaxID=268346 RepID=UPI0025486B9D|nr:uncharacterized protein N7519_006702 [Penicillium mononematosum]KAJ6185401.1 hypothetical protein N7519_006702 [Penicillium mononematosum]
MFSREDITSILTVWKAPTSEPEWDGLGVGYPSKTTDSGVVELYAIACGMKFALDFIDDEACSVSDQESAASPFFPPDSTRTMSYTHDRKMEVIVFTDYVRALQPLKGTVPHIVL